MHACTHTHTHTHAHTHFIASFRDQLTSYLHQLDTPEYMGWVSDAIEKEKMKQQHLQGVVAHLETEVSTLAQETVSHMQESMLHVSHQNSPHTYTYCT